MIEFNNSTKNEISKERVLNIAKEFVNHYDVSGDISIAVIDDKKMKEINNRYRGKDETTDVLSFVNPNEILLSFGQIERQAKGDVAKEFDFILVHGLLHLCGYEDDKETDRIEMIRLGNIFLDKYYEKK